MPEDKKYNYWVITESERCFGPYSDYATAFEFASINLGMEGWTITVA